MGLFLFAFSHLVGIASYSICLLLMAVAFLRALASRGAAVEFGLFGDFFFFFRKVVAYNEDNKQTRFIAWL